LAKDFCPQSNFTAVQYHRNHTSYRSLH